jgi:hypothetical protein
MHPDVPDVVKLHQLGAWQHVREPVAVPNEPEKPVVPAPTRSGSGG